ncbi:MAG: agmatinase [Rhodobacteraceae bacterium]|nr:agmatinase [Paracoccaceae bacterium]
MGLQKALEEVDTAITRGSFNGHSHEATFSGITSFLRRPYTKNITGVDLAITGIPFDSAVTNRPGTRFGPRAIREASALQTCDAPYGWGVDPMVDIAMADYGDLAWDYANVADFPRVLEAHITGILDQGAACLCLGGDHFITYPIMKAHAAKYGSLALVQFDAHCDTWPDNTPGRLDHGTMFYKAIKDGIVDVKRSVQIGIRTSNEDPLGVNWIDATECHRIGPDAVVDRIKNIIGDHPTYVTFDIDALDPAYAPGTGTPVWGGLASWQAAAMLRGLAGINVVGMDVVEVSPPYDTTGATAIAGAHVAMELACLWAVRHGRG